MRRRGSGVDRVWGRVSRKSTRRAATLRKQRLAAIEAAAEAKRLAPLETVEAYEQEARLAPRYLRLLGIRDAVLFNRKPMLWAGYRMRQFRGENHFLAKARFVWVPAVTAIAGVIVGAISSADLAVFGSSTMKYSSFGSAQVVVNGMVLTVVGGVVGVGLTFTLYLARIWGQVITDLEVLERADAESPDEITGVVKMNTYRLAWLSMSGTHFGGPTLASGLLDGTVSVLLPPGQTIEETDFTPLRVRRRYYVDAPHGFDLAARREVVAYEGFDPYSLEPADPDWTGVADRERASYQQLAQTEGRLSRETEGGLGALLAANIGYTGGVVMLVLSFFLIMSWE